MKSALLRKPVPLDAPHPLVSGSVHAIVGSVLSTLNRRVPVEVVFPARSRTTAETVERISEDVSARLATPDERATLQLDEPPCVLVLARTLFTDNDLPGLRGGTYKSRELGIENLADVP